MFKKPSELSDKERVIIHWAIFIVIILYAAYYIYLGFANNMWWSESYCVKEENNSITCFDSLLLRNEYLVTKNYPIDIDYKYINNYTYIVSLNNS